MKLTDIFELVKLDLCQLPEFPCDLLYPGSKSGYGYIRSTVIPNHGFNGEARFGEDYVTVPMYDIGTKMEFDIHKSIHIKSHPHFSNEELFLDDVKDHILILPRGFESPPGYTKLNPYTLLLVAHNRKMINDAVNCLISAGYDRNIVVYDQDCNDGLSSRLLGLLKSVGKRNSRNKYVIFDTALVPYDLWLNFKPKKYLYRISYNKDGLVTKIFGVNLIPLHGLSEGGIFNKMYFDKGGTLPGGLNRLVIGLSNKRDALVCPYQYLPETTKPFVSYDKGFIGLEIFSKQGFGVLDNINVLLAAA